MIKLYTQIAWSFIKNIKWTPLKISIALNIVAAGVILFLWQTPEVQKPEILVVEKTITIPGKKGKLDTIHYPAPYAVENPVNITLLQKYESLKDSIAKKQLFKEAITENEYNEMYEDSTVKISVYTKVRGKLLKQAPTYLIKPSKITYKDTTSISIAPLPKIKVYGGIEVGQAVNALVFKPQIKANLLLQNKKENIWSASYDSNNTAWIGYLVKF